MKRSHKQVQLTDISIWADVNPRLELGNEAIENLMLDIGQRGLIDPITCRDNGKSSEFPTQYTVLKGHRRLAAVQLLKERDPETFNEKFPGEKITAEVIADLSDSEALEILQDHGQQEGLTNPAEVYLTSRNFFNIGGCSEKDVVMHITGMLDRLSPPSAKQRDKVSRARQKVADAGTVRERVLATKDLEDVIFQYRRGMIQHFNRIRRAPRVIEDSFLYTHTKHVRDGVNPEELIVNLTTVEVRKLFDIYTAENETGNFNRDIPGPRFWGAWLELKGEKEEEDSSEEPRAKAMSANKIKQDIKDGVYESELSKLISNKHVGEDVNSAALKDADKRAYYADVLALHDPAFWAGCVEKAKELISAAAAAAKEAAKNQNHKESK